VTSAPLPDVVSLVVCSDGSSPSLLNGMYRQCVGTHCTNDALLGSTRERKARTNHQKGKNSQIPLHKTHTNFLTDITLKYLHDNRTTLTAQKSHKDICTQSYKNRSVAQKCLLKIAQVFHKETHKSRTRKPSHKISHNHSHKNRTKTGTKKSHHHSHKKIVQKYLHNSRTKNILTKISYRPECQMSTQISHKTVCTTLAHRRGSLK
jgi:hypothetical protein